MFHAPAHKSGTAGQVQFPSLPQTLGNYISRVLDEDKPREATADDMLIYDQMGAPSPEIVRQIDQYVHDAMSVPADLGPVQRQYDVPPERQRAGRPIEIGPDMELAITRTEDGSIIAVCIVDEEHRILRTLAEAPPDRKTLTHKEAFLVAMKALRGAVHAQQVQAVAKAFGVA